MGSKALATLIRTKRSIHNFTCTWTKRGVVFNSPHSARGYTLRDRYDEARDWLKENTPEEWEAYCKDNGLPLEHEAIDFWA